MNGKSFCSERLSLLIIADGAGLHTAAPVSPRSVIVDELPNEDPLWRPMFSEDWREPIANIVISSAISRGVGRKATARLVTGDGEA